MANNLVITKEDQEFGIGRFENELKQLYVK